MSVIPPTTRLALVGAGAAVLLAAGSTVALAAMTGGFTGSSGAAYGPALGPYAAPVAPASCTIPALSGTVVDVTLTDMGAMMGGRGGGYGGMMGGRTGATGFGMRGAMSLQASPTSVPAGTVSLRVANDGVRTHEVVVLPLSGQAQPGQRTIGPDGTVSEDGSLGEASATCAAGTGDGIAAGSDGWVTLDLAPGRYELVCNLPGHYGAGMNAELDVRA